MGKKVLQLLILSVVAATAFFAGLLLRSPPQLASAPTDDLPAAWQRYIGAQNTALAYKTAHDFHDDTLSEAEAYRGLLYTTVGAIRTALLSTESPRFARTVDWSSKSGLDNPDNNYFITRIDPAFDYRITATRGTTSSLYFQLLLGQPGVRGAGSSTTISMLDADELLHNADGNLEIIVSAKDPGKNKNWLRADTGAETLLVRQTFSDWQREVGGTLHIERIGTSLTQSAPLNVEKMQQLLVDVAASIHDRTATWLSFAEKAWTLMPRNGISKARPTQGGLTGQYSAFGSWDLQDGEVLIIRLAPAEADYQGLQLGNRWFVSLNYDMRLTSLTLDQSHRSRDGYFYYVLSKKDPGIQNWLDTEAHAKGLIMLRWQGLQGELGEAAQAEVKKINFAERWQYLPEDTPRFDNAKRQQQLKRRYAAVKRRFPN
jgi:hypothetical protein